MMKIRDGSDIGIKWGDKGLNISRHRDLGMYKICLAIPSHSRV